MMTCDARIGVALSEDVDIGGMSLGLRRKLAV